MPSRPSSVRITTSHSAFSERDDSGGRDGPPSLPPRAVPRECPSAVVDQFATFARMSVQDDIADKKWCLPLCLAAIEIELR